MGSGLVSREKAVKIIMKIAVFRYRLKNVLFALRAG